MAVTPAPSPRLRSQGLCAYTQVQDPHFPSDYHQNPPHNIPMKITPLTVLLFLPCLALAESPSTVISPEVTKQLAVMTANLKLTSAQQNKIRPILAYEAEKKTAIESNTTLSDKQKHDQVGTVHRAALQQIKKVFTPEQMKLIESDMHHSSSSSTSSTAGK